MKYDVIVVGCGAGGAAASWYLSKIGLRVACVERGKWQSTQHYPTTQLDWEYRKHSDFSYDPNIRNAPEDYTIDCTESDIRVANFNAIGGSTILFSGHFPRFHPSNFKTKTLDGVGEDWPISYEDLEPYYALNDKMMSVSGLSGDTAYPPIDGILPPVPIGQYGEEIAKAFNSLSWHWWPSYAAIATKARGDQAKCINLGPCNVGCPQGAKSSVDVNYVPAAMRLGLVVYSNTVVTKILSKEGHVSGLVVVRDQREKFTLSAKIIILACNAVGTARLLLSSAQSGYPNGLGNESGLVGKNLMMHPLGYAEGLFNKPIDVDVGPQGCCIYSHEFYETRQEHAFKCGYTLHVLRGGGILQSAISGLDRREINWGDSFIRQLNQVHKRRGSIAVICEDLPEMHNQVIIDKVVLDNDGLPLTKVKYRMGNNTKKMMAHGITSAKRVLKTAGLTSIKGYGPVPDAGWHLLGTARMGINPRNSVANEIGELHGVKGLFVADSSLFPTSGGVNPASTIQAVALYVADHAAQKYFATEKKMHATN